MEAIRFSVLFALGPAFAFFALDTLARLNVAALLDLQLGEATRAAALPAALLGSASDLVCVLPAYALWALFPRPATRRLTHAVFAVVCAIVAIDLAYFYQTFEHVEPVVFVNFNLLSVRGTLGWTEVAWSLIGILTVIAFCRWNRTALARAERAVPGAQRFAALAVATVVAAIPLVAGTTVQIPLGEQPSERFLNKTRNDYLEKVSAPVVANLFRSVAASREIEARHARPVFDPYTGEEQAVLEELRLPAAPYAVPVADPGAGFTRLVFLVLESLPAAYLHHYNPRVPAVATPVLDGLLARYPHLDRFYTSNSPSDWGLNSLFLSRLRPQWEGGRPSLLSELREAQGFVSYYVRGVTKHYGNELATYPRMFQMDHYYAFEELDARYDEPWRSSWGYNNEVVYAEGLRILKQHRDDKVAVVLKTIDLHQPGPFQGVPKKYLPPELQQLDVGLYNALHWIDGCVGRLLDALQAEDLFDDRTLVVITSDHSPQPGLAYKQTVPEEEYERLGRLPLIFVTPNTAALAALDTEGYGSQIDLAPTVLALLGVDAPAGFQGRSLLGADPDRYRVGVYRDTLFFESPRVSLREPIGKDDLAQNLRNRTLRKWLRNQDADPPPGGERVGANPRTQDLSAFRRRGYALETGSAPRP
jgi:phosphoglycerol transferase MdoB-like AlkP superfamily enzyme